MVLWAKLVWVEVGFWVPYLNEGMLMLNCRFAVLTEVEVITDVALVPDTDHRLGLAAIARDPVVDVYDVAAIGRGCGAVELLADDLAQHVLHSGSTLLECLFDRSWFFNLRCSFLGLYFDFFDCKKNRSDGLFDHFLCWIHRKKILDS